MKKEPRTFHLLIKQLIEGSRLFRRVSQREKDLSLSEAFCQLVSFSESPFYIENSIIWTKINYSFGK
jgi:hypothetical protein